MKDSKFMYRLTSDLTGFFNYVNRINGVCSAITLHDINPYQLKKLTKDQLQFLIIEKIKKYNNACQNEIDHISIYQIKTVIIYINKPRTWSLFTPWKFGYSYKGNSRRKCRMFYINFK